MIKVVPRYVDHLWYPIVVRIGGYSQIIEMQGKEINEWNDIVANQEVKKNICYI